jgi:hypothetical protein
MPVEIVGEFGTAGASREWLSSKRPSQTFQSQPPGLRRCRSTAFRRVRPVTHDPSGSYTAAGECGGEM